jgi:ABC-type nitrate/sulfonate/bicarbonate transport system ATPase subunit
MDEPFGALDAKTQTRLQDELVEIRRETGKTILFITHDIAEAVLLADRIGVMTQGPGARIGTVVPIDLPRPRRRGSPDFGEMWEQINALLEGEEAGRP